MQVVSPLQQPVHLLDTSTPSVNPQDGAPPFGFIQFQSPLGGFHQRAQGDIQLLFSGEDLFYHHFLVVSRQDIPDLPSPAISLTAEIAGSGEGGLGPTRPSRQVNIQPVGISAGRDGGIPGCAGGK